METLEVEITGLRARLAEPDLYTRDRAAFDQTATALEKAESDLAAARGRVAGT